MPSNRRPNKSRRPRRRQIRRPGPPLSVVRVSFIPGATNFALQLYGSPFQGFGIDVPFSQLLAFTPASSSQNVIVADSRLVFLQVVLAPNSLPDPVGVDVLLKGFPQLDSDGTVVGRTTSFISTVNSTRINCRLPPSVTQYFIGRPETDSSIFVRLQYRYYIEKPPTAPDRYVMPVATLHMKFRQQPIETMVLR